MAIDCVCTGRVLEEGGNKFLSSKRYRKGELVVVWKKDGEVCFVITAYWKR
ncbi:MAG: hypothetical protein V1847_00800 [Candidatus Diapherotrites archaeon]